MNTDNNINALNSEPLINEVENVIRKGINNLLGNFSDRYLLLEDTHSKIMKLPSVQYQLNGNITPDLCNTNCHTNCNTDMNELTILISNLIDTKLLEQQNEINKCNEKMFLMLSNLNEKINVLLYETTI